MLAADTPEQFHGVQQTLGLRSERTLQSRQSAENMCFLEAGKRLSELAQKKLVDLETRLEKTRKTTTKEEKTCIEYLRPKADENLLLSGDDAGDGYYLGNKTEDENGEDILLDELMGASTAWENEEAVGENNTHTEE